MRLIPKRGSRSAIAFAATFVVASMAVGVPVASAQTNPPTPPTTAPPHPGKGVGNTGINPAACASIASETYYPEYNGYSTAYEYSDGCNVVLTFNGYAGYVGAYYYSNHWVLSARGLIYLGNGSTYQTMITNLYAGTAVKIWNTANASEEVFYY